MIQEVKERKYVVWNGVLESEILARSGNYWKICFHICKCYTLAPITKCTVLFVNNVQIDMGTSVFNPWPNSPISAIRPVIRQRLRENTICTTPKPGTAISLVKQFWSLTKINMNIYIKSIDSAPEPIRAGRRAARVSRVLIQETTEILGFPSTS